MHSSADFISTTFDSCILSSLFPDSVAKIHKDVSIVEISAAISEQLKRIGQRYHRQHHHQGVDSMSEDVAGNGSGV